MYSLLARTGYTEGKENMMRVKAVQASRTMLAMTMLEAERERLALRVWRKGNTEALGCDAAAGGAALRVFGKLF